MTLPDLQWYSFVGFCCGAVFGFILAMLVAIMCHEWWDGKP